jgi:hypothetical protein
MIRPASGKPLAGLSTAQGLVMTTPRVYLVFLVRVGWAIWIRGAVWICGYLD